jgi:Zn finger protein HypA/HybF involved in hydrogenase expression
MNPRILDAARDYDADPCRDTLAELAGLVAEAMDECCHGCGVHTELVEWTDFCPDCNAEQNRRYQAERVEAAEDAADHKRQLREDG